MKNAGRILLIGLVVLTIGAAGVLAFGTGAGRSVLGLRCGDGICDSSSCRYVDADGDGICDSSSCRYVDANGDGVCDNSNCRYGNGSGICGFCKGQRTAGGHGGGRRE